MTKMFKKPLFWTNVAAFTVTGLVVASVAFGWTNPSATPPTVGGALKVDSATGNVGIGLDTGVSASQKLDVKGYVKGQTGLCISGDCRTSWPSGIGGSGTSGKLSKFTGATTIGDSVLTESSGNIGIGLSPGATYKLDVSGKINGTEICIAGSCKTSWPAAGITGSGTIGKIPKWTGSTSLGDSAFSESAGIASIGTDDFSADSNLWGAQSSTKVDPAAVDGVSSWVGDSTAAGGHANWTAKCPTDTFMIGLKQNHNSISSKFGVEVLCAEL